MSSAPPTPDPNPPYLLRTPRLVLRCLEPADVPLRKEATDASLEHLSRIISSLRSEEGRTLEAHAAAVRHARGTFDLNADRTYGAFAPEGGRLEGECFLLQRAGLQALELGYWLRADATGRGLATEMGAALVRVAFEHDRVRRLDLVCHPDNARSVAVARRLGFTLEGRLRDRQLAPHHDRTDLLMFSLLASEYPQTLASRQALEAYDFLGRRLF